MRGIREVQRAARWIRSRFVNGALILLYHRVSEVGDQIASDPFSLCVTPQHFAEQLAALRKIGQPMSLQALAYALRRGNVPRRAVAITFDDGYADNLYHAKPLLEHYKIPATVFIATGYIDSRYWWDELAWLLLQPETLPDKLCLTVNGHSINCKLPDTGSHTRRRIMRLLHRHLRSLSTASRRQALDRLATWSGAETTSHDTNRALSSAEIAHLVEGGLIEVGAHTVTHPALSTLSTAMQRHEIRQSKVELEQISRQPVTSFSYPYGLKPDYTPETTRIVQEAGFEYACSGIFDIVWQGTDLLQLPRFWVQDWDGVAFTRQLKRWLRD